jgi:hypothetical protein
VVRVFEGSGAMWTAVRVPVVAGGFGRQGRVDGQLKHPFGLRFTGDGDGTGLAVADAGNRRALPLLRQCCPRRVSRRVSVFRVEDGSFVRHVATGLRSP